MKTILSVALAVTLALSAMEASAQGKAADRKVELAIEQQSLADALNEWAKQTGLQLVSQSSETMNSTVAPKIKGAYTAKGALEELLKGTSLTYEWVGERAVAIRAKSPIVPAALQSTQHDAEQSSPPIARFSGESRTGQRLAANDQRAARADEPVGRDRDTRAAGGVEELEEIVVTGSRLRRARTDGPAPVTVFDRARIEQLGATSVSRVLDYLPQQPFAFGEGTSTSASREVRLRGLSSGTTLVLINGRRVITSALTAGSGAFDLNSIPLAAVERIEILSESASAIYGADAIAGVVNVILKEGFEHPTVDLYYGAATEGGANERRASFVAGHNGDRLHVTATADIFEQSGLLGRDRDRTADLDFTRFGSRDARSTSANPGNICTADFTNLPGLSGPCAAVPTGSTGVDLTSADFAGTVGEQNLTNPFTASSIIPESRRVSAVGFLSWDMSDRTKAFAELLHSDGRVIVRYGSPALSGMFVSDTQAFNPFDVPLIVDFQTEGVKARETSDTKTSRAVIGLKGDLPMGTWRNLDWEFNVLGIREDGSDVRTGALDFGLVDAALNSDDPDQALNVFEDGPGGTPAFINSLLASSVGADNSSRAWQASAFARTELVALPAGPLAAVVGAETRVERLEFVVPGVEISSDRKSSAAYAEVSVPLVDNDMGVSAVERLTLKLAGRYDHYDDFGNVFNPQYGLEWQPISQLLLRASYSTSFKAPSLVQLHRPTISLPFLLPFFDPARGEFALTALSFGGNPDLAPEEGRSFSVGAVLTPGNSDSHRLSINYWKLVQTETVRSLNPFAMLANESLFPGLVTRDPPSAEDIANGVPGVLRAIDTRNVNFGRIDLSGFDVEASTRWDTRWGSFSPSVTATRIDRYDAAEVPGEAAVSRVARASTEGSIPRYRATATLAWSLRSINLSATGRYTSSYKDFDIFNGAPTDRTISAVTLVDLQGSVDLGGLMPSASPWLKDVRIRLGIVNLFDKEPEFSEAGEQGYDPSLADLRQRFGYVSVSKDF